ncbi:MAG: hypothetical protein HRU19_09710 [Pseudobacteriovorax sp.]|nr:hypothetical protein [Pseudobacteriovorax sp.]
MKRLLVGSVIFLLSPNPSLLAKDFMKTVKSVSASPHIGQGNPKVTKHAATKKQCQEKLKSAGITYENKDFEAICGARYMAPLYDPSREKASDAKACIDQFEYPNLPCEYPVVWVRADEAHKICQAEGKRMCDAHEWEGGCDGALLPPDYNYELKKATINVTIKARRLEHNRKHKKNWAYGPNRKKGICAANSFKHNKCNGGNWKECGSNTYPAGFFPECKSKLEVYDQHGNAAEHMNLPTTPQESASHESGVLGHTEMKGSWFIFDKYKAHQDWCRWRAPYWHGTRVMHVKSHHNYHLGFRCCKDRKKL